MRPLALAAFLLCSCAPAARIAPDGRAIPVRAGEPAAIDGVLLPVPLAAHLAQSEACCRDCLAELEQQGESVSPWLLVVVGVAAAGAGAAGGYLVAK